MISYNILLLSEGNCSVSVGVKVHVYFIKAEFSILVGVAFPPEGLEGHKVLIGWLVFVVAAYPSDTEDEFVDINGT